MLKTLTLHTEISPEREIHIQVPDDIPTGPAELVVIIVSSETPLEPAGTADDLLRSPLFGLWSDREDIDDSLT